MQSGGGKRKGGAYERQVCRSLSQWITKGERDDVLWRSASSGAVFTIHKKKGQKSYSSQSGDISSIDPLGEPFIKLFSVECKFYASLQLENLIMGKPSILEKFWVKHVQLAKAVKKFPLMIVKQNRGIDLLVMPAFFEKQFINLDSVLIKKLNCCIFNLNTFIAELPFQHFIGLANTTHK